MNGDLLKILMIEDSPEFVLLMTRALKQAGAEAVEVFPAESLESGLRQLQALRFDAIVLDLFLPDSAGLESIPVLQRQAPDTPVVVMSAQDDPELAIQALRLGAQDYLVKGKVNGQLLVRSLRYAISRQQMVDTLRRLSMFDELTGLYNRRGFSALAKRQLKLSRRSQQKLSVFLFDMEGTQKINEQFGRAQGDIALMKAAEVLRRTFRSSDILARLDGDDFIVLAVDTTPQSTARILSRLMNNLLRANQQAGAPYRLSLRWGVAAAEAAETISLEKLISRAEQALRDGLRTAASPTAEPTASLPIFQPAFTSGRS